MTVLGGILLAILSILILLIVVYVASGIQMRSWLDILDKYLDDKFNNMI
jgi:hypothetical protein